MPKLPGTQWMIPVSTVNSEYRWLIQLDVLFIEGIPYRRLIGINNQKLPPELIPFESQKYDCAVATIYTLSPQQRQQRLVSPEVRTGHYGHRHMELDRWAFGMKLRRNWTGLGQPLSAKNIETPAPTPGFANNVEQTNRGKEIITFSNFKKFCTESRILNP
jgi:hypothetical protein